MLGKLVNGALSYAPRKIIIDGKTIFNPTDTLEAVALPEKGICPSVGGTYRSARYVQGGRVHDLDGWNCKEMCAGY